jgi:hypothetical protein
MENELDKQTAVDYYSNKIGRITSDLVTGKITGKQFVMLEIKLLDTAKKIEKQQIINAVDGFPLNNRNLEGEQYYAKTYGGKDGE